MLKPIPPEKTIKFFRDYTPLETIYSNSIGIINIGDKVYRVLDTDPLELIRTEEVTTDNPEYERQMNTYQKQYKKYESFLDGENEKTIIREKKLLKELKEKYEAQHEI